MIQYKKGQLVKIKGHTEPVELLEDSKVIQDAPQAWEGLGPMTGTVVARADAYEFTVAKKLRVFPFEIEGIVECTK